MGPLVRFRGVRLMGPLVRFRDDTRLLGGRLVRVRGGAPVVVGLVENVVLAALVERPEVTCSSCRAEECEPFCHGNPSVCKFDLCPVNAAACGDGWAFACQNFSAIAPEDTKRALADPATHRFTPASIAGALEKWNARMRASGADCDCSAYSGGEHAEPFCKKSDLCAAVEGILDPTPPERSESAWDGRCCAYCVLASEQGECGLWSPTSHYGHILERVLPLLSEL